MRYFALSITVLLGLCIQTYAQIELPGIENEKSSEPDMLRMLETAASSENVAENKEANHFSVTLEANPEENPSNLAVHVEIAPNHYLYVEHFSVQGNPANIALQPEKEIAFEIIDDPFTGEKKSVYTKSFDAIYPLPSEKRLSGATVEYMGCSKEMCFMPETVTISWKGEEIGENQVVPVDNILALPPIKIIAQASGSMNKEKFLSFLEQSIHGTPEKNGDVVTNAFHRYGLWLTIPLIILLGIGLNLTPCVLPMIPINLAIIGASTLGATNQSGNTKRHGLLLGGIYGLGMALAYGGLGLAVVLAGSTFGSLNSSPWFNIVTAIIFVILALAMFDIFVIDLSRFQKNTNLRGKTGITRFILIFGLGVFSALLAGACVAPVLIAVLLLSTSLYSAGNYIGLLLPFFLGTGMALPWPIAGAGLTKLPKPGMWMVRVKQCFGVLILLMAAYYGYHGYQLWQNAHATTELKDANSSHSEAISLQMDKQLADGIALAKSENKPLFIDFWATWCKSCMYMEKTTFSDPEVQQHLNDNFVVLKLQAEYPKESPTKEILNSYGIHGLPTYLIATVEEAEQK